MKPGNRSKRSKRRAEKLRQQTRRARVAAARFRAFAASIPDPGTGLLAGDGGP